MIKQIICPLNKNFFADDNTSVFSVMYDVNTYAKQLNDDLKKFKGLTTYPAFLKTSVTRQLCSFFREKSRNKVI